MFSTLYHGRIKLIYGQNLAFSDIMCSWRCFLHYIMAELNLFMGQNLAFSDIMCSWRCFLHYIMAELNLFMG